MLTAILQKETDIERTIREKKQDAETRIIEARKNASEKIVAAKKEIADALEKALQSAEIETKKEAVSLLQDAQKRTGVPMISPEQARTIARSIVAENIDA